MRAHIVAAMFAATFLLPGVALAQGGSEATDSQPNHGQCTSAYEIVVRRPEKQPDDPLRQWALELLPECGSLGGQALAEALSAHRLDAEPTNDLNEIAVSSRDFIDGALFSSALRIATDDAAGVAARVTAIRIIYGMFATGTRTNYDWFVSDTTALPPQFTAWTTTGSPLPNSAARDARDAMRRITASGRNPALHNAAEKLAWLLEGVVLRSTP